VSQTGQLIAIPIDNNNLENDTEILKTLKQYVKDNRNTVCGFRIYKFGNMPRYESEIWAIIWANRDTPGNNEIEDTIKLNQIWKS